MHKRREKNLLVVSKSKIYFPEYNERIVIDNGIPIQQKRYTRKAFAAVENILDDELVERTKNVFICVI